MLFGKELSHLIEEQICKAVESQSVASDSTGIATRSGVDEGRMALVEANLQRLTDQLTAFIGAQKKSKRNIVDYGLAVLALHDLRLAVTSGRAVFADRDEPLDLPYTYLQLAAAGTERQIRYVYLDNAGVVLETSTDPSNMGEDYIPLAMIDVWSGVTEVTQDKIKDLRPRAGSEENISGQANYEVTGNATLYSLDTGDDSFIVSATNPAGLSVHVSSGRALVEGEIINAEGGLLDLTNHRHVVKEFIAYSDGTAKTFSLFHKSVSNVVAYVNNAAVSVTVDAGNGTITFNTAPAQEAKIEVSYSFGGNYMLLFLVEKARTNDGSSYGVINWKAGSNRSSGQPPELAPYQHAIAKVAMSGSINAVTDTIIDNAYEVRNLTQYALQYGENLDGSSLKTGAITGDKIAADTITGNHIIAGGIDSANIKAGAITSNKIAVGAIEANHIAGKTLNLDDGLTITSTTSGLQLTEDGMRLLETSGAYTKFDKNGIKWVSAAGIPYGAITRIVSGVCPSGKYVRLNFDKMPIILLSPQNVQTVVIEYPNSDIKMICEPYDVSQAGFRVRLQTKIMDASGCSNVGKSINSPGSEAISFATPSITTDLQAAVQSSFFGSSKNTRYATFYFYYKLSNDNTWTYANSLTLNYPPGDSGGVSGIQTVATGLNPGSYQVKVVLYSESDDNPFGFSASNHSFHYLNYSSSIGVIDSSGAVNFIAIESDGNNYYTIED